MPIIWPEESSMYLAQNFNTVFICDKCAEQLAQSSNKGFDV